MKIGPYQLLNRIGKGGMGVVFLGHRESDTKPLAIKIIKLDENTDPLVLKRFEQEFAATKRLEHPHIVRGLDFGAENGRAYLVMEYVDGLNLNQIIQEQGALWQKKAVELFLQISDALTYVHEHNFVHRDVKPGNILVTREGHAYLTDLGLVKDLDSKEIITRSRTCLGTLHFMAPEQYENAKLADPSCDVYALGSTLYFAVTGAIPFSGGGHLTTLANKLQNKFIPPKDHCPSLNDKLSELICRSIDVKASRRPRTCKAFTKELQDILDTFRQNEQASGVEAIPEPQPRKVSSGADRRSAERYESSREASCATLQNQMHLWEAKVLDLSMTGARIHLKRRFEPDTVLMLQIYDEFQGIVSSLCARVRWVRPDESGGWLLGCSFNSPLDEEDLDDLLDSHTTIVVVNEQE